jgi:hypothetical protein
MAHNLTSALRAAGFDITFLPFWNYKEFIRMELTLRSVLNDPFRLVICFLGDSFGLPWPNTLIEAIERSHDAGAALLFFPFLAWSVKQGLYPSLSRIVPVKLQDQETIPEKVLVTQIAGSYRLGDFRWLLTFDSFAEDQYAELDPADGHSPFTNDIDSRFGFSHSFEYLTVDKRAQLVWADTSGNPIVITDESGKGKICYLNTCCHSCMAPFALLSPLEATTQFGLLMRNTIKYLVSE